MIDVFLERTFESPLSVESVLAKSSDAVACLDLHRVRWWGSHLARNGHRMICRFHAPDLESVRIVLREAEVAAMHTLWSGTVHDAPGLEPAGLVSANVLVERSFRRPVTLEQVQALEDAGAGCLQSHRVRFMRTYLSLDHRRMICMYQAPDAESVRLAQQQAGMPLDRVWSFQHVRPANG